MSNILETPISTYRHVHDNKGMPTALKNVVNAIRGGRCKSKITEIRDAIAEGNKDRAAGIKKTLPAAIFSGVFGKRAASGLDVQTYTGIITLDIDGKNSDGIDQVTEDNYHDLVTEIISDSHTLCCFKSPSGNGIKVLCKTHSTHNGHLRSFNHIKSYYEEVLGLEIDPSGKDVSRLCFLSDDEDIYFNEKAIPFEIPVEDPNKRREQIRMTDGQKISDDIDHIFRIAIKFAERTGEYYEGNRNNFVHNLACILNRAGVTVEDAITLVTLNYDLEEQELTYTIEHAYRSNVNEFNSRPIYEWGRENKIAHTANLTKMDAFQRHVYERALYFYIHGIEDAMVQSTLKMQHRYLLGAGSITTTDLEFAKAFASAKSDYEASQKRGSDGGSATMTIGQVGDLVMDVLFDSEYIETLVDEFNTVLRGGFRKQNVVGIVGPGGAHKSNYAVGVGINNAKKGIPTIYVSGEMAQMQLIERLIFKEFRENIASRIKNKDITKEQYSAWIKKIDEVTNHKFYINDTVGISCEEIGHQIEEIKEIYDVDIEEVIIDGMGHMSQQWGREAECNIENSKQLKELAKDYNVAVIVLCHTTTGIDKHKRNQASNVRGGMKVEANLDATISHSLIIDRARSNESAGDYVYIEDMYYSRLNDKRGSGKVVDKIISVNCLNIVPDDSIIPSEIDNGTA